MYHSANVSIQNILKESLFSEINFLNMCWSVLHRTLITTYSFLFLPSPSSPHHRWPACPHFLPPRGRPTREPRCRLFARPSPSNRSPCSTGLPAQRLEVEPLAPPLQPRTPGPPSILAQVGRASAPGWRLQASPDPAVASSSLWQMPRTTPPGAA